LGLSGVQCRVDGGLAKEYVKSSFELFDTSSTLDHSEAWTAANISDNEIPIIAMGVVLLLFLITLRFSIRRDRLDAVETAEKLLKWKRQGRSRGPTRIGFHKIAKKQFQALHLWFSIVYRPRGDAFHSVDRLFCLLTFVLSSMAINAILFGSDLSEVATKIPDVKNLFVLAFASALGGSIISLLIVPLFSRSGPPSARQRFEDEQQITKRKEVEFAGRSQSEVERQVDSKKSVLNSSTGCCCCCCGARFPAWVEYIGFTLCTLVSLGSIYLVLSYMLKFASHPDSGTGPGVISVSRDALWLCSSILSWILDIVLFRPLQILGLSLIMMFRERALPSAPQSQSNLDLGIDD